MQFKLYISVAIRNKGLSLQDLNVKSEAGYLFFKVV